MRDPIDALLETTPRQWARWITYSLFWVVVVYLTACDVFIR